MMARKPMLLGDQGLWQPQFMPQIYYHKQLKAFADMREPTPMQESWIKNIIGVLSTIV